MRIERFTVDAFGRLTDFDSGGAPLGGLVVVLGPNEAGKSTLFDFLTTMLYGFHPASREANPLVPWGSDEARGTLSVRLADGRAAAIARRLRSQPSGQLSVDDGVQDLRNQPVPWVEHVPRRVFRQVFAVTLGEMAGLDDETWARIQDRVVGAMGATDLRSVRSVADELEREAGESWRPNRRGKQRIREARERMRDLRARRRDAGDRDRQLRSMTEELESARRTLRAKRDGRAREEAVLERARSLLPVRAQLLRVARSREEGGPREPLAELPPRPHERLLELQDAARRIEARLQRLDQDRRAPEAAIAACTPEVRGVLDQRDAIVAFVSSASTVAAFRERIAELRSELEAVDGALDRVSRELTGMRWHDAARPAILEALPGTARDAIDRIETARREADAAGAHEVPGDREDDGRSLGTLGTLAAGVGALLVAFGTDGAPGWAVPLGAALTAGGAALVWTTTRGRRAARAARAAHSARVAQAQGELAAAMDAFRALTGPLGLSARHADRPGPPIVTALEQLQDLHAGRAARHRALEESTERVRRIEREGRSLAERLGLAPAQAGSEELGALLSDRLRRAERAEQGASAATRELDRLMATREESSRELATVREEEESLREAAARMCADPAAAAGPGSEDEAALLERAWARMQAHEHADRLEEELHRSHPDLASIRAQIDEAERSGAAWLTDQGDMALRRSRIERLNEEIEALRGRAEALEAQIEHARGIETADWVDGEVATLEEEIEGLVRERDRKWVLAELLREADRRFREAHQPDLLRRAGRHLSHLTGGRYDRILIEEGADRDVFRIAGPELAGPIALRHPISTGTLEQAYLGLRLAIVDHLDDGTEPLPLFVDEIFVNWDAERRARGVEVLTRVSEKRQVFVFTCHASMARELEDVGARVLPLGQR